MFKGKPEDPLEEDTTFGWVIHSGDDYVSDGACTYSRKVNDYERLYSLHVLGVGDRCENDQQDVLCNLKENIARSYEHWEL